MFGQSSKIFTILLMALGLMLYSQSAYAQGGGGNPGGGGGGGGNNGGGGGGNGDGGGTADNPQLGGVEVDAQGVLRSKTRVVNAPQLNRERLTAWQKSLNKDVQAPSQFRKVSLTRLEREIEKLVKAGKPIPATMQYLAGLTKITHVFFYPETQDIVIAGPAEGFFLSADNHVIGMNTGRATLHLQDLVVALRAFAPDGKATQFITCSIDPTNEGLLAFKQTYNKIARSGQFRPGMENQVIRAYQQSLGLQKITVGGVSNNTHFARVLVEADYEMKLIGIGLKREQGVTSFIETATPQSASSIQRWFFQPDYECVSVNHDRTAMEIVGDGVKLVGEDERLVGGKRQGTGAMSRPSRIFCNSFTKAYGNLANRKPLWAELRNVIDMSVVAAFIQKADLYRKADWQMTVFGDEAAFPVETYDAPTDVAPVANAVWKGRYFMSPIAGGVNIQAGVALNSEYVTVDDAGKIDQLRDSIDVAEVEDSQWWWD